MNDETQEVADTSEVTEAVEAEKTEATEETTEATENTDNPDSESDDSPKDEKPEKEAKRNRGAERRIKQQNRENRRLKEEMEAMQAKIAELSGERQEQVSRDDYATEEDYLDAVFEKRQEAIESAKQARQAKAQEIEIEARRESIMDEALELIEDFDSDKFEKVPVTENMATAIINSDEGAELVAFLYENPKEAEKISSLAAGKQQAAIGRLEARLAQESTVEKSKAPPPVNPLKGGSNTGSRTYKPMSTADYIKWEASRKK